MLRAILNKSWQQHPTRHQLYGHLPPITKTIQVRRTRHAGHCWRSRDELIRDVLLWIPTHGRAKAGRPARTYIQQLCEDTGCCPEDLPRAMNDREEWRERVRDIRATSAIWWWWWWLLLSLLCLLLFIIHLGNIHFYKDGFGINLIHEVWYAKRKRNLTKWNLYKWIEFCHSITDNKLITTILQNPEAKYGIGRIGFMPFLQSAEAKHWMIFANDTLVQSQVDSYQRLK